MTYGSIWKYGTGLEENIIGEQRSKTNILFLNRNYNQHWHILFSEIVAILRSEVLRHHTSDQKERTSLHLEILSINMFLPIP